MGVALGSNIGHNLGNNLNCLGASEVTSHSGHDQLIARDLRLCIDISRTDLEGFLLKAGSRVVLLGEAM